MHGDHNRGLLQFDLSSIPAGSRILSASCSVRVVGVPTDGPQGSIFDLHRILRPWGEGTELATAGAGRGSPATTNEVTWNDRFAYASSPWESPGGTFGIDFATNISAEKFIADLDLYGFRNGTLAADVQFWLDNPDANFGWMLKTREETTISTARRFGSREDPDNAPFLTVDFLPGSRIESPHVVGNTFTFSFLAYAGQAYAVQSATALGTNTIWNTLTNIPAPDVSTNIVITDALAGFQKYYQITTQ